MVTVKTSDRRALLEKLGIEPVNSGVCSGGAWFGEGGDKLTSYNPGNGEPIADVWLANRSNYDQVVNTAQNKFLKWRETPAPVRGHLVRDLGELLREYREPLGELVSLEVGKIRAEGIGEVQEMIDIFEFAIGLSRQLCGATMHSERPGHRMYEQWHPLGPIGIITAFNFPVAVWSWNAALAATCGDTMVWKPSPQAPLTAIAVQHLANRAAADHNAAGVFNLTIGSNEEVGEALVDDPRLPLVSFTGSCAVGKQVACKLAARMGRSILELGGNNAIIVEQDADFELAVRGILFGAVGTAGQRCTTTRRVFAHESIIDELARQLVRAYGQVTIGDPLDDGTLMGPLINQQAIATYRQAIATARQEGGEVLCGNRVLDSPGSFVEPTIIRMPQQTAQVRNEAFVPILYLMPFAELDQAIAAQNDVPQGLSSAIFTSSLSQAEQFLSAAGSDCGIANVNIGTSGAEVGGAFGGEKETGGGRESGSDAWKAYMRRQTTTINWSKDLPLAQGIQFG